MGLHIFYMISVCTFYGIVKFFSQKVVAKAIFWHFLLLALIIFLNLAFQVLLLIAVICHISDTYINLQKTASIKIFSLAITYVIGHKSSIHFITLVALINSIFLRLIIIFL